MAGKRLLQALPFERHLPFDLRAGYHGDCGLGPWGGVRSKCPLRRFAPPPHAYGAGRICLVLLESFKVGLSFFPESLDPFLGVL
jgi:hypothetical protein